MTVPSTPLRAESAGNDVGLNHPYDWKIDSEEELLVTQIDDATEDETTLVLNTDYTVTGVGDEAGGNVVINPALATGQSLVIIPNLAYSQTADFTNQNAVPPEEVESALDRLSIQVKSIIEILGRTVTLSIGETSIDATTFATTMLGYKNDAEAAQEAAQETAEELAETLSSSNITYDNSASGLTATTAQDAIDTISSTVSGLGTISTQASDNVSITGGVITGITDLEVADGGTGRSSSTAYAVVCGGITDTGAQQSVVGVGTNGQILTSNGPNALPSFKDNQAILYNADVTSTSTIDISGFEDGKTYKIYINNIQCTTDGTDFGMRFSTDSGSSFLSATNYFYDNGVVTTSSGDSQLDLVMNCRNATYTTISGEITLHNIADPNEIPRVTFKFSYRDFSGTEKVVHGGGGYITSGTVAMNAVRLFFGSGNFSARGHITCKEV